MNSSNRMVNPMPPGPTSGPRKSAPALCRKSRTTMGATPATQKRCCKPTGTSGLNSEAGANKGPTQTGILSGLATRWKGISPRPTSGALPSPSVPTLRSLVGDTPAGSGTSQTRPLEPLLKFSVWQRSWEISPSHSRPSW
jgi:hypothetical protein